MIARATSDHRAADPDERLAICDVLDRVLNKGVVVTGEVIISVADVELLYVGLQLVLTSVDSMRAPAGNRPGEGGPWS